MLSDSNGMLGGNEPKVYLDFYKTKLCPNIMKGYCNRGEDCNFAHNFNEIRSKPNLYKTRLCQQFQLGLCMNREICPYAHGELDLRSTPDLFKTSLCYNFSAGKCEMGSQCRYAHGIEQLRPAPLNHFSVKKRLEREMQAMREVRLFPQSVSDVTSSDQANQTNVLSQSLPLISPSSSTSSSHEQSRSSHQLSSIAAKPGSVTNNPSSLQTFTFVGAMQQMCYQQQQPQNENLCAGQNYDGLAPLQVPLQEVSLKLHNKKHAPLKINAQPIHCQNVVQAIEQQHLVSYNQPSNTLQHPGHNFQEEQSKNYPSSGVLGSQINNSNTHEQDESPMHLQKQLIRQLFE